MALIGRSCGLSSRSFFRVFSGSAKGLTSAYRAATYSTQLPKPHELPPRRQLDENDIKESFLKGSGPGGQKINKTNSAVQLTHGPTGIVIKCQETRSRTQNRKIARRLLAEKVDALEAKDEGRMTREDIKTERKSRKKASAAKKRRRKYRALAEEDNATDEDEEGDVEEQPNADEVQGQEHSNALNEPHSKT